jgi:acyl-CoA synthetase (NDP forming)
MGMIKDPSFGPVVMFGLGGVFVEVLKDVSFRIVPIEKSDAEDMINEIKGKKLLEGYRGQEPADVAYLQQMLLKLSDFVNATPEIEEIDMNPVFAYKDGAVVVDARIILSAA